MGDILAAHFGRREYKNSCTDNDTAERMIITPYGNNVELNVRRKSKSWRTLQTLHS